MWRGFNTLAAQAEKTLAADPFCGHLLVFRGRRGDLLKISLTAAQLAMLLEGIDWRIPQRTWRPLRTG